MTLFGKALSGILVALILNIVVGNRGKEMQVLLTMGVCCMVCILAFSYLEPILDFLNELKAIGNLQNDVVDILLKAAGVGIAGEVVSMLCNDSGSSTLGKAASLLTSTAILYLSLPLYTSLITLLQNILEGI